MNANALVVNPTAGSLHRTVAWHRGRIKALSAQLGRWPVERTPRRHAEMVSAIERHQQIVSEILAGIDADRALERCTPREAYISRAAARRQRAHADMLNEGFHTRLDEVALALGVAGRG